MFEKKLLHSKSSLRSISFNYQAENITLNHLGLVSCNILDCTLFLLDLILYSGGRLDFISGLENQIFSRRLYYIGMYFAPCMLFHCKAPFLNKNHKS